MEATPTPRVSSPHLDSYVGRNVMIVGKVVQLRGDQAIIDADGNITAHLNRVSPRRLRHWAEEGTYRAQWTVLFRMQLN
jgi:hypothetical protein